MKAQEKSRKKQGNAGKSRRKRQEKRLGIQDFAWCQADRWHSYRDKYRCGYKNLD